MSPLLSLVSTVLIITSSLRIIATVDAFTAVSPTAAIPSSSSSSSIDAINYHYHHQSQRLISSSHNYVTTNNHRKLFRQQPQQHQTAAVIMSLKASSTNDNNDNEDQQKETTSTSSYTHHYNKITTLIGRTTSTLISLLFFLLLATQRNVIITTLFIGSILNAIVGKILKKILDHDRPFVELYETAADDDCGDGVGTTTTTVRTAATATTTAAAATPPPTTTTVEKKKKYNDHQQLKIKPSDGGMPSSHAMSLSFIGTVLFFGEILPFITRYVNTNNVFIGSVVAGATSSGTVAAGAVVGVSMMLYSFIALQYRVRVKLHTVEQILVGYTLGLMNAILWLRYAVFSPSLSLSSLFTIVNEGGEFGIDGGHGMNHLLGPVSRIVQKYLISNNDTNQFPVVGLVIPILLGIVVVGSFERRIGVWLKKWNDNKSDDARVGKKDN
jgi:membrane-associated phospholipid phosphatase